MSFQKPFALQYFAVLVVFAITARFRPLDSTGREVGWHATAWKKEET
jgi:hypothetical protein